MTDMVDVSGWHASLRWAARSDSVDSIVQATFQTCERFIFAFGEFRGTWHASSAQRTVELLSPEFSSFVTASVVRTSGAPDPTRGISFALISPTVRGVHAMIRVRAGATHESRRSATNSVTMDFLAATLGEPPIIDGEPFEYSNFASCARSISDFWNATDVRLTDRASGELLT
ncbi:hypothetical protein [Curtobacterium sp. ME26]|uniref:hypothetical protein n=1 Tax=Curtobacterium sp. ME26 TaxID=2744254 RepID=UPI0015F53F3C|nr:hypothetical protein [Curtobacterium sp. ME26]